MFGLFWTALGRSWAPSGRPKRPRDEKSIAEDSPPCGSRHSEAPREAPREPNRPLGCVPGEPRVSKIEANGGQGLPQTSQNGPKMIPKSCQATSGLTWTGLDWLGLAWLGLDCTGLDWPGLDWLGLVWPGMAWTRLDWLCLA